MINLLKYIVRMAIKSNMFSSFNIKLTPSTCHQYLSFYTRIYYILSSSFSICSQILMSSFMSLFTPSKVTPYAIFQKRKRKTGKDSNISTPDIFFILLISEVIVKNLQMIMLQIDQYPRYYIPNSACSSLLYGYNYSTTYCNLIGVE